MKKSKQRRNNSLQSMRAKESRSMRKKLKIKFKELLQPLRKIKNLKGWTKINPSGSEIKLNSSKRIIKIFIKQFSRRTPILWPGAISRPKEMLILLLYCMCQKDPTSINLTNSMSERPKSNSLLGEFWLTTSSRSSYQNIWTSWRVLSIQILFPWMWTDRISSRRKPSQQSATSCSKRQLICW